MQFKTPFDPTQHAPSQSGGFSQITPGDHIVTIVSHEIKECSSRDGSGGMQLILEASEGPCKGAQCKEWLNLFHNKPKAQRAAEGTLSAYCHAIGHLQPVTNPNVLYGRPFMVEMGNKPLTDQQEERKAEGLEVTPFTEVKKIKDVAGNVPGEAPTQAPAPAPAQQQQEQASEQSWGNTTPAQQPAAAPAQTPAAEAKPDWMS